LRLPTKRMAAKADDSSGELQDGGSSDPCSDARAHPPAALLGSPCSSGACRTVMVADIGDHTESAVPDRYSRQSARRRPASLSIHQATPPERSSSCRSRGPLLGRQPLGLTTVDTVLAHPVAQRGVVDTQLPGDHTDRSAAAADQLHRSCLNSLVNPRRVCWTLSVFLSMRTSSHPRCPASGGRSIRWRVLAWWRGVEGYEGVMP
jgi:hypothetical protein